MDSLAASERPEIHCWTMMDDGWMDGWMDDDGGDEGSISIESTCYILSWMLCMYNLQSL